MSFGRNFEFWWVGVAKCKKTRILKIEFLSPLNIVFFFAFCELVTHEPIASLLAKCVDAL